MAFDLKMEVYAPTWTGLHDKPELLGFLESQNHVMWRNKAFTAGSFSSQYIITNDILKLLQPENIIWIEGDTAGIIEYMQAEAGENGPYLTVSGPTLTGLLDRYILWGQYNLKGTPPEIMCKLVDECCVHPTRGDVKKRKIPGLVIMDPPSGGDIIQVQRTGSNLLETCENLGQTYGVAYGIRFNPAVPQMEFWTRWGRDLTINQSANNPVLYSTELDDVLSSEYTYNSQDYRNVALVGGEGEGADRVYVTVNGDGEMPTPPTPPEPPVTEQYTVTLSVDPQGGGIASGGRTVAAGTSITVTASPNSGYEFVEWRENGVRVSTNPSYTFTVNADRALVAVFAAIVPMYTISVTIDPAGYGTVTGAGQYKEGDTVTLKATAGDGYKFTEWRENGAAVHSGEEYTFTASRDVSLVTAFEVAKPSRLPAGYTEVEYIQSSGDQYINTQTRPTSTTKISIDVEPVSAASSSSKSFIGSYYVPSSGTKYYCNVTWQTSGVRCLIGSFSAVSTSSYKTISSNTDLRRMKITVDYPGKTASVAGEASVALANNDASASMAMLKLLSASNGDGGISARLYSATIEDSSAKYDLVPCINPSKQVGLYDLVGGAFYGNAGTGAFTAGPAV